MIKEFVRGRWYRYTGEKRDYWNSDGKMDFVLDNKPHLCVIGGGPNASFSNKKDINNDYHVWNWSHDMDKWEETPAPKTKEVPVKTFSNPTDNLEHLKKENEAMRKRINRQTKQLRNIEKALAKSKMVLGKIRRLTEEFK